MYTYLLLLHSWWRWAVVLSLLFTLAYLWSGMRRGKPFDSFHSRLQQTTTRIVNIQFLLGLALYVSSPLTRHFLTNFSTALHERELRFFGLEHIVVMLVAVTLVNIGSERAKRATVDREKFRQCFYKFLIAFLLILSSIPWTFSPFTARPSFRFF
jgi:hypothetical protein